MKNISGVDIIKNFLKENKLKYVQEYSFDDCVYKKKLRFDFAVFNSDGELKCLIEYDGVRHFKNIHKEYKTFQEMKLRDKIKDWYCLQNNIDLIRIGYMATNSISNILNNYFYKKCPPWYDGQYEIRDIDLRCLDLDDRLLKIISEIKDYEYLNYCIDNYGAFGGYHIDDVTDLYLRGKLDDVLDEAERSYFEEKYDDCYYEICDNDGIFDDEECEY